MGGKKKKTVANKLAKMSDEERARYMQHRAEMEEEAKRRKEQLIATFMKKKVKKEEAFSRLNIAKINQNWHQILRKSKCQELKQNIEQMKKWLDRVIRYKNETIRRLVKELDEAEEHYLNNFDSHSNHIDDILKNQKEYIDKMNAQYQEDLKKLLSRTEKETSQLREKSEQEQAYLKTMLYRQGAKKKMIKEETDRYMQNFYEDKLEFQSKIEKLRKTREAVCAAIWTNLEATIVEYIEKTDPRRLHLGELTALDHESAIEINKNKERIQQEEALKDNLEKELERLRIVDEHQLASLNEELEALRKKFDKLRRCLQKDMQVDEKKLKLLVDASAKVKDFLEQLVRKGENLVNLAKTCRKYETSQEKIFKWYANTADNVDRVQEENKFEEETLNVNKQDISSVRKKGELNVEETKVETLLSASPTEHDVTAVRNVTLLDKPFEERCSETAGATTGYIDRCLKSLEPMDNFWMTFNKAEVNYLEILEEKKLLEMENKQLRGMIRAILEARELSKTIPNSNVPTRLTSRRISAHSAPFRKMITSL